MVNNILTQNKVYHKNKIDYDSYITYIASKLNKNIIFHKNLEKIDNDLITTPYFGEHFNLTKYNYNMQQLKTFAKNYKLKGTGNKQQLITRLYFHLYLSFFALKIQKTVRGHFQRRYNQCHGPAYLDRSLCTNNCDFFTMDDMKDIKLEQFFSYKDDDGFVYGFDLVSLYNLIINETGTIKNPYNRREIKAPVIETLKRLFRLSNILKVPVIVAIEEEQEQPQLTAQQTVELRILHLFQAMNSLGNYAESAWFLSLNRSQIIKFMRELMDIWTYRAQLTVETKRQICPPYGDPFSNMATFIQLQNCQDINILRICILPILEKLVNSGVDRDNKSLGTYYVLAALTLVNSDAASSMPWLYQSVVYA